jgi:hypothetical protein
MKKPVSATTSHGAKRDNQLGPRKEDLMPLTPRRPELRGTCEKAAKALAQKDPSLAVLSGWYIDTIWGPQEHWWCTRTDGEIVDPTVEQFPTGHVPALREYVPYEGLYPCIGCGTPVRQDHGYDGFCCGACYGSTVGIPVGRCEC